MKVAYEVPIIHNELNSHESLANMIMSLDRLDTASNEVFEKINKSLIKSKFKLESLKSRVNRVQGSLKVIEETNMAITMKSSALYPSNKDNTQTFTSLFYEDACDFNLIKHFKINEGLLNTKPSNSSQILGKNPNGSIEDIYIKQQVINDVTKQKTLKDVLKQEKFHELSNLKEIDESVENCVNMVDFYNKDIVFGKKSMLFKEDQSRTMTTLSKQKKSKNKNVIQEAPKSISEKQELTKYKQHKDILRTMNKNSIEINIPSNLKLSGIAENFDTHFNFSDEFSTQRFDHDEKYIKAPQIESDDINEDIINPLEFVREFNKMKQSQNKEEKETIGAVKRERQSTNNERASKASAQSYHSHTNANRVQSQSSSAIPVAPKIPSVPQVPKVPVPMIPKVPLPMKVTDVESKEKKVELKEKMEKITPIKPTEQRMSLLDELKQNNFMKLKKTGSTQVKTIDSVDKQAGPKSVKPNPATLLKEAIRRRYTALNPDKEKVEEEHNWDD